VSMRISKSKFVAGMQCLKRLYWQLHEPELAAQPDAASEVIIQQGHEVGMLSGMSLKQVARKHSISRASVCRLMKEANGNSHSPVLLEGASIRREAHV
jgi:hypothetical protein